MDTHTLEKFKQIWSYWQVRALILLSLSFQIILLSLGRLRKTSTSLLIQNFLWISYIVADLLANYVLTQQSRGMNDSSSSNNAIFAFWAPFLILHLGGPDNITAYSMEDNELWARHLLGFMYSLSMAIYVLFCSLPNTVLLAPTVLIFLVAIIKYLERSYSLYIASAKRFYSSSLLSFEKSLSCDPLNFTYLGKDMLNAFDGVFELYLASKPYFIGVTPVSTVHEKIIDFIDKLTIESSTTTKESFEAVFTVTFMELSYVYDELYTKAIVNHSRVGYVLRAFCTICILVALSLFVLAPKISIDKVDVVITYVLLTASVFLDAIAAIMLFFSDWMMFNFLFELCSWSKLLTEHIGRNKTEMLKRRYALQMPQLNIIKNSVEMTSPLQRMVNWIKINLSLLEEKDLYPNSNFITKGYTLCTMKPVNATLELLEIIAPYAKECIERSFRNLDEPARFFALYKVESTPSWVVPSIVELIKGFPFDQQVLIWHISTELCFHWKSELHPRHRHQVLRNILKIRGVGEEKSPEMKVCEYLSNYMIYLVLMQPDKMFTMERTSPRMFYLVFEDLIKFIHIKRENSLMSNPRIENVCRDRMRPVLRREVIHLKVTSMLAHLILLLEDKERWEVVTKAWVELLILGAENTKANMHMKQLSRGVDLLTFIWLLCKYFGIEYPKKAQHSFFEYVSPEDCEESFVLKKMSCIEELSTIIESHLQNQDVRCSSCTSLLV